MTGAAALRIVIVALAVVTLSAIGIALVAMTAGPFSPTYWFIEVVGNLVNGFVVFPRVMQAMAPRSEQRR